MVTVGTIKARFLDIKYKNPITVDLIDVGNISGEYLKITLNLAENPKHVMTIKSVFIE